MAEAHEIMGKYPDLGATIKSATQQVDGTDPNDHYVAPLIHEMYYQSQEGQDTDHFSDDEPMALNLHRTRSDSSSSDSHMSEHKSSSENENSNSDSNSDSESDHDNFKNYDSDQDEDL
jgi:hypothetical protein